MRTLMLLIAALLWPAFAPLSAQAEPVIKVINFTAEWCPNCQILNPALEDAIAQFPEGEIELVTLDMTFAGRGTSQVQKLAVHADAIRLADSHQAGYLWDWYGGVTGLAAIISADNGEPLSCVNRIFDAKGIEGALRQAQIITVRRTPGIRMPNGPDCPPPLR